MTYRTHKRAQCQFLLLLEHSAEKKYKNDKRCEPLVTAIAMYAFLSYPVAL